MSLLIYQRYARSTEIKTYMHGKRVANLIADNINEINTVGNGYYQYFTLPEKLYGNRNYTVSFFKDEPTVFVYGSSFLSGITLYFSSPLNTVEVKCFMAECNNLCNSSPDETCLVVNDTMSIRVVNDDGIVFLAHSYNIVQGANTWTIVPYMGNKTASYDNDKRCILDPANISDSQDTRIYLYKNIRDNSLSLIIKNGPHPNPPSGYQASAKINITNIYGNISVGLSDDSSEFDLSKDPDGDWTWSDTDKCDGGVINIASNGVYLCMTPSDISNNLLWLNSDGSSIELDKTGRFCLSYP